MNTTTTTTEIERQVDEHLAAAHAKTLETDRIAAAVADMGQELATLDSKIMDASEELAAADLKARLDGAKAPKPSPELDGLHGQRRRLEGALAAADAALATLAGERSESLAVAGRLGKLLAQSEFETKASQLARAWQDYYKLFSEYSAAAHLAGAQVGWNGPPAQFDGMRFEAIEGQRCNTPDYDPNAFRDAITRSNAARVLSKIPAPDLG